MKVSAGSVLPRGREGESIPRLSPGFWCLYATQHSLVYGSKTPASASVSPGLPFGVSLNLKSPFPLEGHQIRFRAHPKARGTHCEIFNLITTAMAPFPNRITFTSTRD